MVKKIIQQIRTEEGMKGLALVCTGLALLTHINFSPTGLLADFIIGVFAGVPIGVGVAMIKHEAPDGMTKGGEINK